MNISSETIDFIQIIVQIVQRWIALFFYSDYCSNRSKINALFFYSDYCSNCSIFTAYKKAPQ